MTDVTVQTPTSANSVSSYVEWAPIFAGSVLALSVSFVLLTFGSAVGLAVVSPWSMVPVSAGVIWGGAFWLLLVLLWSFALGGYIAGRMRHRWAGASEDEVAFRDGAHGLLAWGLAVILGVTVGSLALSSGGDRGTSTASVSARSLAGNPVTTALDHLFRTTVPASSAIPQPDPRPEAGRLLFSSGRDGILSPADRTYLVQLVSARTGLTQSDAEARVTDVENQLKMALDKSRKVGIVLGFLVAASLLVAAATAWWAACVGGNHRDLETVWHGFARNQRLGLQQGAALQNR